MKNKPITLTLPEETLRSLHLYVPHRQRSSFVARLVERGLAKRKEKLAREFREAANDQERNREIELWDTLNGEGLDETNAY